MRVIGSIIEGVVAALSLSALYNFLLFLLHQIFEQDPLGLLLSAGGLKCLQFNLGLVILLLGRIDHS
jgi:hypothetical protein